ncbi:Gag-Pol polyprotein [Chionoecetes opilio]|uniref:Gag-Pol polyprotein n=1 Tax=Chionoecetes opilio TaxID=41210 RepID=A0A8J4YHV9_CHIOP|nr:Gag-Pol polyprotein [Chionoecetes opilio]
MFPWLKWIIVRLHGGFLRLKSPSLPLPRQTHHSSKSNWLWREHIAVVSSSVPAAPHLYVDGSLQPDGSAGCAVYSLDVAPPEEGWVGRRLPNLSNSTYCELQGLLLAVSLLCQRRLNGVVMFDSQSALQAISSPQPTHRCLVHQIVLQLVAARDNYLTILFLWIPSHVGIAANDKVDLLTKIACGLPLPDGATPSHLCFKKIIHSAALFSTARTLSGLRVCLYSITTTSV